MAGAVLRASPTFTRSTGQDGSTTSPLTTSGRIPPWPACAPLSHERVAPILPRPVVLEEMSACRLAPTASHQPLRPTFDRPNYFREVDNDSSDTNDNGT